jgi:hypothetical protein
MSEKTGYKPTSGMQSAARRAIKLKEQGKANGAGTAVGWTRAGQLARGESLSLSTVKRMYSFFSRHEVDKKGKDWDNAENPSNGKIMWLAWGGDAGFSWSRKIVEREKNMKKSTQLNEFVEKIKDILDDVVNPITKVIEIEDDSIEKAKMTDTKDCKCDGCMECKAKGGCDMKMCQGHTNMNKSEELSDEEISKNYVSDNEEEDNWDNMQKACWSGYKQVGTKEKNGKQVPNCVPIEKENTMTEENPIKKSLFGNLDPYDLIKRKFNTKQREEMAQSGEAMPDGSYPIANRTDLMNAIRSWGRGGSDPKVKAHIKRRAKALDAIDMIPDNWK